MIIDDKSRDEESVKEIQNNYGLIIVEHKIEDVLIPNIDRDNEMVDNDYQPEEETHRELF